MQVKPGALNLITDVAGLKVGNAQNDTIKTGTTVLIGDAPFTAGVSVMGGAPGTRETDLLAPDKTIEQVDALVLSGGSAFGLDAASGVADALRAQGRGFAVGDQNVPIVSSAILFDLINGGDKGWIENPYKALGAAALAQTGTEFAIGSVGAGTGATTANLKGGLGSASFVLPSGHTVGALVAVNALGQATVGDGAHFWAAPFEMNEEYGNQGVASDFSTSQIPQTKLNQHANTTIGIVATDAPLTQAQCTRMATAAHDGYARALVPSHTPFDGDLIFAASTGEGPPITEAKELLLLGHFAAQCMARAIARAIYAASPVAGDTLPCWQGKFT
ncbi:Peptidase family S58 [Roseovarius albus]|uniref:Peptidase family S58 n=1 Tax=Roseovarius albus TaxID=1247867 RepID=A0A1X6YUB6_9RHOB|nr:P1 family peptidase [Roseovarius albus]SLN31110.1 Peptidase family S58 [Roseovarius albus]